MATIEPYHTAADRQRTETDLILRGTRHLVMVEAKLGYKEREISGWQQSPTSPIVPYYEKHAKPLLVRPEDWRATLVRFVQLYKNLMLGRCLAEKWLGDDAGTLAVHLLAIANGATVDRQSSGRERRYADEFAAFRETCVMERGNLHFTTWQDLLKWASEAPTTSSAGLKKAVPPQNCA